MTSVFASISNGVRAATAHLRLALLRLKPRHADCVRKPDWRNPARAALAAFAMLGMVSSSRPVITTFATFFERVSAPAFVFTTKPPPTPPAAGR